MTPTNLTLSEKSPQQHFYTQLTTSSIVALHGISAHRDKTWGRRPDGTNWLGAPDMLPRDIPCARILSYGYSSNWLGPGSMSICLDEVAGQFLSLLHEQRKASPPSWLRKVYKFLTQVIFGRNVRNARSSLLLTASGESSSKRRSSRHCSTTAPTTSHLWRA